VDTHASYRHFLPQLAEEMGDYAMASVGATMLEDWIHQTYGREDTEVAHPGTFNTARKRLVALWRWARKQGFIPDTATTEAEKLEPMRAGDQPIGVLSLNDYAAILCYLKDAHPEHLAVAVLAGFAGLRRVELHRQRWEDIDPARGLLRVTAAKRNTVSYRLVHLSEAAVEWLRLCPRSDGKEDDLIAQPWGLDRVRTFAREKEIPCPPNAFRHAFISYRCAATGNVAETAQEAGNSPGIVHKHYRELFSKADGESWFNLTPAAAAARCSGQGKDGVVE
jgi:integrase